MRPSTSPPAGSTEGLIAGTANRTIAVPASGNGTAGPVGTGAVVMSNNVILEATGGAQTIGNTVVTNNSPATSGGTGSSALTLTGLLVIGGSPTVTNNVSALNLNGGVQIRTRRARARRPLRVREKSLYNATSASYTAANTTVASVATLALNVGGAGQFTASDVALISGLGTASAGFQNGSFPGLDTTGGSFTYGTAIADTNGGADDRFVVFGNQSSSLNDFLFNGVAGASEVDLGSGYFENRALAGARAFGGGRGCPVRGGGGLDLAPPGVPDRLPVVNKVGTRVRGDSLLLRGSRQREPHRGCKTHRAAPEKLGSALERHPYLGLECRWRGVFFHALWSTSNP